jgi:hypothetical protein
MAPPRGLGVRLGVGVPERRPVRGYAGFAPARRLHLPANIMKSIETIDTKNLKDVTGGCAACGNPAHGAAQQLGQQAAQWGARLGQRIGGMFRR